MNEEGLADTA
jgi:hypothetical protein